ncbi:glycogen/starch/alpha-glucan phosphorylase [Halobacillus shinanisalinarum]|uniref:Alpha-1,4 glucan phosphorylase n=1 Tax=Halobacillus shinanisalinarum TaxID=2932258 RepID=A0ABY4H532_9BACI|nr:glycogen/starch/alpha-glucan phosphorylase [Halobacillus shinanisalinarum]UOQ95419.1 glycogen/starch/alpha-glucan phosphorylase [Halobacillus shinanisalinarum]
MFNSKEEFIQVFSEKIETELGKGVETATELDAYRSLGALVKDRVNKNWLRTNHQYLSDQNKQVYYFSMEFLMGRLLGNNLLNMQLLSLVKEGLADLGFSLTSLEEQEHDAGLGNGGLGRLAACFLDSLASLGLAGHGYGIRYKYGMFDQAIIDGYQVELPDQWLANEFIWEIRRPEQSLEVRFGGHVHSKINADGTLTFEHVGHEQVQAVPYDVPVIGYNNETVNTLRLWSAEASQEDTVKRASQQDELGNFLTHKRSLEEMSDFLYPDDSHEEGRKLRLKQEYFLVSAGVQSAIRSFEHLNLPLSSFPEKVSLHINDTHPALVIPELMRVLIDVKELGWEEAWTITQASVSYTNHTTLSEALETWPVDFVRTLLPRLHMIIEEINERFCQKLWSQNPGDFDRIARLAIIADGQVKMAHLAIVGSHSVNGVAKLHTEILKTREMKHFYAVFPERFNNKTNGITHRRWLIHANKQLADHITEVIGDRWVTKPERLRDLLGEKDDSAFLDQLGRIKQQKKQELASFIKEYNGTAVDTDSIFDVHIKRLHGYKRQLLNALHIMYIYHELKSNPSFEMAPRTFIFAAKAAPSYHFAKKVIKLITRVADVVNNDPLVNRQMKVVFLENYSVSLAERIIPATDISEQISTASKEASGTGNMKFMMNGALTLGTLDGANVEIHDLVGDEGIYTFGLSSEDVLSYGQNGGYSSREVYESDERVRRTLDQLVHYSPFSKGETEFRDLYESLLAYNDEYFVVKDFASYVATQQRIGYDYQQKQNWNAKSLLNIAHSGRFSSDRTIQEYAQNIWNIRPVRTLK